MLLRHFELGDNKNPMYQDIGFTQSGVSMEISLSKYFQKRLYLEKVIFYIYM